MLYYAIKVLISALTIVTISEIAKRNSLIGALIASLPLTSILAIIWMKVEKVEINKIIDLSKSIFWLVIPSLSFFILFPIYLKKGISFWISFIYSISFTIITYFILIWILRNFFDISL